MAGQLSLLEREIIFKMLNENQPLTHIAKTLHRHHSSIAEEIKRNRIPVFKGSFGRSKCFCQNALDKTCRKKNLCPTCPTPNRYCFNCQNVCTLVPSLWKPTALLLKEVLIVVTAVISRVLASSVVTPIPLP